MEQYISKSALVTEIEKRRDESWLGIYTKEKGIIFDITDEILSFLDTLEVKEAQEKPVNKDLEDYAKKESESFAEREYEIDYIDRNALAKGYYWGVKAGAQWQALHSLETIKEMEGQAFLAGVEAEQINKSFSKDELLNKWRKIYETE